MADPLDTESQRRSRRSDAEGRSEAPHRFPSGESHSVTDRRIRHSKETNAAIQRLWVEPTKANVVALHEVHATHLRELGDEEAAARADERAQRARDSAIVGFDPSSLRGPFRRRAAVDEPWHRGSFAEAPPLTTAQPDRADETTQVQYARVASQRADAALQRAVERSDRAETHDARARAARQRSAAAQRRVLAAEARGRASGVRLPLGENHDERSDERDRVADERELIADEREQIADERDKRADDRDRIADTRERATDEREKIANERQRFLDALGRGY
jgi:sulfite oxidase